MSAMDILPAVVVEYDNINQEHSRKRAHDSSTDYEEECIDSVETDCVQAAATPPARKKLVRLDSSSWETTVATFGEETQLKLRLLRLPRTMQVKVAAISGKIGSGKNYLMEQVVLPWLKHNRLTCVVMAYADELKFRTMTKHKFSFEQVFFTKPQAVRVALQDGGSRAREEVGPWHWIEEAHKWLLLHAYRGIDVVLFSDNRHINESQYIKYACNGAVFRIEAPKRNRAKLVQDYTVKDPSTGAIDEMATHQAIAKIAQHESETALDNYDGFDAVIANEVEDEQRSPGVLLSAFQQALGV
jgi:hypothetical protein